MKRYIHALCIMLLTASCLTSCLKGDDTEVTYYDDMAITTFELSVVNRYIHSTTSAGNDTTTITTLKSGLPVFNIDQYQHQIYNREPLPTGCDLEHILVSITSKNSGQIIIKSLTNDSLFYYSSADSIDFSQPREIRVYALDGSGFRSYQVNVNVKDISTDEIQWERVASADEVPQSLFNDILLEKGEGESFKLSKDNGVIWTEETLGEGEDATLLPASGISWISYPYTVSKNADYELMVGCCESNEEACTIWRKVVDRDAFTTEAKWVNIPTKDSKSYYLPKMNPVSLVWLSGNVYAIGSDGKIYKTRDGGIIWKTTDELTLPNELESYNIKAATDESGRLYLRELDNGQLWRTTITWAK